jgi:hypothetical protein
MLRGDISRVTSRVPTGVTPAIARCLVDSFDSSPLPLFSRSLACAVVMGGLSVMALGCGDHLTTVPVTGSVRVDGKPAAGVQVVLHPVDADDERLTKLRPTGRTAADGTFVIGTYEMSDGAPVAEYRITAEWFAGGPETTTSETADPEANSAATQTDRLGGRFANPETSALKASVGGPSSEIPAIDLSTQASQPPG